MGVLSGRYSGLEILHGGEAGDVELGARTSKHILSLRLIHCLSTLSLLFVQSIIHFISFILLVLCVALLHIAYLHYMLGLLVCVPHLYLTNKSFT